MQSTLLLNASYEPLRVIPWQRAITLFFLGKVEVVETYEHEIRSVSIALKMPCVVRLLRYVHISRHEPPFSKLNLLVRDEYRCQYCGQGLHYRDTTIDHILPRSLGGATSWLNCVAACHPCNRRKGGRTPQQAHMPLLNEPYEPEWLPVINFHIHKSLPDSWIHFVKD